MDRRHDTLSELLAVADMTMYDAKEAGRNQWTLLDDAVHDQPRSGAYLAWNRRVQAALANDQLVLHLQPIWDLVRQEITGAEVLLRLADGPELVYPDRFLYIAERSSLITRIDKCSSRRMLTVPHPETAVVIPF